MATHSAHRRGDTFLNREDLRGILDSGHNRTGAFVLRCDGESMEPKSFSTWSPKAIARIGKLAATLADRSIPIALKRKTPDTEVERQPRNPKAAFETLRRKCIRWACDNFEALSSAKRELPEVLGFRAQDNWERSSPSPMPAGLTGESVLVRPPSSCRRALCTSTTAKASA